MRKFNGLIVVAIVFLMAVFLIIGSTAAQNTIPEGKAAFRFLNLSPDAGPVDLFIDGRTIGANVDFRESGAYVTIDLDKRATHSIYVVPTGKAFGEAIFKLEETRITDALSQIYILTGTVQDKSLRLIPILDSMGQLDAKSTHIVITHLIADGPSLAVTRNGKAFVKELKPGSSVSTSVESGSTTFDITAVAETSAFLTIREKLIPQANYVFVITDAGDAPEILVLGTEIKTMQSIGGLATPAATGEATMAATDEGAGSRSGPTPTP